MTSSRPGGTVTGFSAGVAIDTVYGNLRDGINLAAGTHDNVVDDNLVYENGHHGLVLGAGFGSVGVTYREPLTTP